MPAEPPPELVALLARLGLATRSQVRGVGHRVHRLARELPLFESVWVDALAQARVVTPYQAAEINAGRGDRLLVGPLLLCHKLPSNGLGELYVARATSSGKLHRLLQVPCPDRDIHAALHELESLVDDLAEMDASVVARPEQVGIAGDRLWASCRLVEGHVAAQWLAHNGRLPPVAVLEIARRMLPGCMALEACGRIHGDLGARQLLLTADGGVSLPLPGIRGIVRPAEGYAHADLQPEAYDYLAPEQVLEGSPPTTASDLYALGCLWWQLLTGRPPLSGGDALSKLRSAQVAKIVDVRQFAPDAPRELIEAIAACTQRDPRQRPESMARLLEMLGPGTRAGRDALVSSLQRTGGTLRNYRRPRRAMGINFAAAGKTLASAALAIAIVVAWLGRRTGESLPLNSIAGPAPAEIKASGPPSAIEQPAADLAGARSVLADLVLPTSEPLRLRDLPLRAGQRVCGPPGERPLVLAPAQGLSVACDDVQFDGIDFVLEDNSLSELGAAIVHLRGDRVSFHNCSFQCSATPGRQRTAILWHGSAGNQLGRTLLPTGTIKLSGCTFRQVSAALESRVEGALRLELNNTLHLGPGPLVRFHRLPKSDEPRLLTLNHCTLRGAGALLECRYERADGVVAETKIEATGCALALEAGRGLIVWRGPTDPTQLIRFLQWTGEGSLVTPPATLCLWNPSTGPAQVLPEEGLSVSGLVLSQVSFAGDAEHSPAASRAERWQAPLQSIDPPGIIDVPHAWPNLPR